jgi:hypothetical protein
VRARRFAPGLAVLACGVVIGCTEMQTQLPRDFGALVGPPQKHFEGVPAHGAIAPGAPASTQATVALPEAAGTATPASAIGGAATRPPLTDVSELIGLERQQLQARLGDPALRRRDAPAEIWQYRSSLCVLDLFLYRDGQAVRVTNAEVRPRDGRELPAATCLSSL